MSKTHKALNDKQIVILKRIRKDIISIAYSYEQFADKVSNIGILLNGIIKAIDSIIAYVTEK